MTTGTNDAGLGAGRYIESAPMPDGIVTIPQRLVTTDGAKIDGILRHAPGATSVVTLMHPRMDLTHHGIVPELLQRGLSVWTQGTRSVNNDLGLVHEQALLDMAAGQVWLRERFDYVITLGHSGGGTLAAMYHAQSRRAPDARIATTPGGARTKLADAAMPTPDAAIFMAPHPGQAVILSRLIDPSVTDEPDPLSIDPALDPFNPDNGFVAAPTASSYAAEFVTRYRAAQAERIARIDEQALAFCAEIAELRDRAAIEGAVAQRAALAPRLVTVFRTDADLRNVDLSLDANDRPYGSLMGRRPDLTNYGMTGFGRLSTATAWLSTWSLNHSNALFSTHAPEVTAPTLLLGFSGDQVCFPADLAAMREALGSVDATYDQVRSTHFGGALGEGEPTGYAVAGRLAADWIDERF